MKTFALVGAVLALSAASIDVAEARGGGRFLRENAAGGVTAGAWHNRVGPNGGAAVGGRGIVTDGAGNGVLGSAGCAEGAAGAGCRAGKTTFDAEGNVTHRSGAAFEGANGGTATTEGGFTRNADGTYAGGRETNATGPAGNSYAASTSWSSESGRSRTVTCTDSSGAVVACPTR